jgi:UDP-N-acetylmuramate: L-alanyl-gamma-D-glutamyl-meso-diaminopimelate ligase
MPAVFFTDESFTALEQLPRGSRIHFIGVGGIGMGQLALELAGRGYTVSGSDREYYDPMRSLLQSSTIKLFPEFAAGNITDALDLVVIGTAVGANNPEVRETARLQRPFSSFAPLLQQLFPATQKRCVVSGTFGKSTTTALLANLLSSAGYDPSYFIGGAKQDAPSLHCGNGDWLLLEGDEYFTSFFSRKPKFLWYRPQVAVITAIEFDHGDIYLDLEDVLRAFDSLVFSLPRNGALVCNTDCPNIASRLPLWRKEARCRITTFGSTTGADFYFSREFARSEREQMLHMTAADGSNVKFILALSGMLNARNACAAAAAAYQLGIPLSQAAGGMAGFTPLRRRMETVFDDGRIKIIEDFAHHPSSIRETLRAIRETEPQRRVIAAYFPTTPTAKWNIFQQEYVTAFRLARAVIIRKPQLNWADRGHRLFDTDRLIADLRQHGVSASAGENDEEVLHTILALARPGDSILLLSSGPLEKIKQDLIRRCEAAADSAKKKM